MHDSGENNYYNSVKENMTTFRSLVLFTVRQLCVKSGIANHVQRVT